MIFFIAIGLVPFLVFTVFFVNKTNEIEKERVQASLSTIVEEKASALQKDLKNVENETVNLAEWASFFMNRPGNSAALPPEYLRDKNNVLGRDQKLAEGKSNIFFPSDMKVTPELVAEIINSEQMEGPMSAVLKQIPDVTYAYMVTSNGLLRVYPYLGNGAFEPNHDQRSDYFYTRAVGENNPEKKAVWTNPYYDYGGNGWIITCSSPFYIDGKLGGVVCVDVSLKTLAASVADFRIGSSGFAFVITSKGDIIYHPNMMGIISKSGNKLQTNLLSNRNSPQEYRRIINEMMSGQKGVKTYLDENYKYNIIAFTPIEALNWSLGVEVGKSEYSVGSDYVTMGFWGLIAALLVTCLAMAYSLSRKVTLPIKTLTADVQRITEGEFRQVSVTSEDEIGLLGDAFNKMSREIREYTASLLYGKNQMETVLNSIGGVMMILKPDYSVSMMNEEGLRLINRSDDGSIIDMKCFELFAEQGKPCKNCPVQKTWEEKTAQKSEIIHYQNLYEISSYPVFDEKEQIKEIVVRSRKITEQVMLERELFQSEKMAGVGQMVAGVTHELKNPLAVIKGALYLLKANKGNEQKQEDAIGEINASVSRAEKIIYNMLDFSRTSWADKELVNVRSLLEQILLLVRQDMVRRKINVSMSLEEEPVYLYGNADSFKHIFLNVITNAIDAMPAGGDLKINAEKQEDGMTEIIFSNTGESIPDENLSRIFQPFFTTKEKGTGLGLWIVSKEVSRNGGIIRASNEGLTQIKVTLPGKELKNEESIDD